MHGPSGAFNRRSGYLVTDPARLRLRVLPAQGVAAALSAGTVGYLRDG